MPHSSEDSPRTPAITPAHAPVEETLDQGVQPADRGPGTDCGPGGETMRTCGTAPAADGAMQRPPPVLPGYEILGELGRGGMGVVYRARQIKANRVVALKMILVGAHAGAAEVARFQTEAQAIAALQHPHIVQVFDVGEHDGLPFFSLEFCGGGSLDRKLAGTPLPPMEAARLVETLARAMQAAHQAGVIHRDLKPANVLLAASGLAEEAKPQAVIPKITDFGLAKKLDSGAGQTQSGAIMGTPSYMAPEQARGQSKEIGPAADIYALGAILYECLTGRPPFRAATPLETVFQVVSDEPVPPTQLQSKTPRDLETICLKCLQKDPGKRYPSALALAEDLGRYQRGEPIAARPVGRVERTWRWCRRNPVVASLLASVLLVFATGATVSGVLAYIATEAQADAEQEAENAKAVSKKLEKANADLLQTTDDLVTSAARSLLIPLALEVQPNRPLPPLREAEVRSLWVLAASKEERLRFRFVEEALREPGTTRQLKDRAGVALHAAVGLNETHRAQVEELLGKLLQAQATEREQREHVALCLAHLGTLDRSLAAQSASILIQAMSRTLEPYGLQTLSQGLSALALHLGPKEAADAAATLTQAMSKAGQPYMLPPMSQALLALADRMEAKEAARVCGQAAAVISVAVGKTNFPDYLKSLSQSLTTLTARMEPKSASATLLQAMTGTVNPVGLQPAPPGLVGLLPLSQGLSAASLRLESREAATACARAAAIITQAMSSTTDYDILLSLSQGLSTMARHLGPKEAGEAAAILTAALNNATDPACGLCLLQGLAAVGMRMEPKTRTEVCGQTAVNLVQAMVKSTDYDSLPYLAGGLSALTPCMEPKQAVEAATLLTRTLGGITDLRAVQPLSQGLAAVAARLEAKEAAQACGQVAATLSQAMSRTMDQGILLYLALGLSAVTVHMEPKAASVVLTEAMSRATFQHGLQALAQALSTVAVRLKPQEAAEAATSLSRTSSKTTDPHVLKVLSQGLAGVAAHMEPTAAARACSQAATTLSQAMSKRTDSNDLHSLSLGLVALAARLEPKEAARIVAMLTPLMSKSTDQYVLGAMSESLSAVAVRLEPKEAAEAASTLAQALGKMSDPRVVQPLLQGLSLVTARLEPKEAAAILTQALSQTTDPLALGSLPAVLRREAPAVTLQRLTSATAGVAGLAGPGLPVAPLVCILPALDPMPPPLPAQTLVDLLKHPLCVGEPRRLVLEQLARHDNRPFADQWEFVEYVHQQKLDLDLKTPLQRPR